LKVRYAGIDIKFYFYMIGGNYAFSDRSFDEAKGRVADKYGRILILRNGVQAVANSIDGYHGQIVVQNQ
jgi:hypothetical protein